MNDTMASYKLFKKTVFSPARPELLAQFCPDKLR